MKQKWIFPLVLGSALACSREATKPQSIRLVDLFQAEQVRGAQESDAPTPEAWKFDDGPGGWAAASGVAGLVVGEGALAARTTSTTPVLHVERLVDLRPDEPLYAVEVKARVSAGEKMQIGFQSDEAFDADVASSDLGVQFETALSPGDDLTTYTILTNFSAVESSQMRHIVLRPTDAEGASFTLESVELVFRSDRLASLPSGVSWQGVSEIFRETIVARTGETIEMSVTLPSRPRLDLALATVDPAPVRFQVRLDGSLLVERTITRPDQWESVRVDLSEQAGRDVTLSLSLEGDEPGLVGLIGTPVIRNRAALDGPPQGVIIFVADTLRSDHLDGWGYGRPTAPHLSRLASRGVLFRNTFSQATWTKVSATSIQTSLYPQSHGVLDFPDRLPAGATTLAELYREAGFATISLSSNGFAGQFTNLHQGFEVVHEQGSFDITQASKSARAVVARLLPSLEAHRDVPFFVYIHVVDPHSPFEPYRPYDTKWLESEEGRKLRDEYEEVAPFIEDSLGKIMGLPTSEEVAKTPIDAEALVERELAWYDGSILGMDVELERLSQKLAELDLEERTLLAFISDHGEEFLEHGMHFHGQSLYGELTNVPLMLHWPGGLPEARVVEELVQSIDLMPTLLDLSAITPPEAVQGRSLVPLIRGSGSWSERPAFATHAKIEHPLSPMMRELDAYAIVSEGWKLIHNVEGGDGRPEFELFDYKADRLDARNVAHEHPDVVERLAEQLGAWRKMADAARLPPDAQATEGMSSEELDRLRSLGYVQ